MSKISNREKLADILLIRPDAIISRWTLNYLMGTAHYEPIDYFEITDNDLDVKGTSQIVIALNKGDHSLPLYSLFDSEEWRMFEILTRNGNSIPDWFVEKYGKKDVIDMIRLKKFSENDSLYVRDI